MMNEELKTLHLQSISHPMAIDAYERLSAACESRAGGMSESEQMLIADYCRAEDVKQLMLADIAKRGLGKEKANGRQSYWQKNESVPGLRAQVEQQRKILNELKLTPASRKLDAVPVEDDDFDKF